MTREEWLIGLGRALAPRIAEAAGLDEMPSWRVSVGFPAGSRKAIGQCWDAAATTDKTFEIFIRPDIREPLRVAGVFAHELVHAAVGIEAKHGKRFKAVATGIGLEGKMTATVEGPEFIAWTRDILDGLPPMPGADMDVTRSGRKKDGTRQLKCECPSCGYIVRTSSKWIDVAAPICPNSDCDRWAQEMDCAI